MATQHTRARVARSAIAVLAVTYFALWACGPLSAAPLPTPMADGRQHELGLAPSYADAVWQTGECLSFTTETCQGLSLAAWYRYQNNRIDIGATVFGGTVNAGAGVQFRVRFLEEDRFFWAVQLDAGFLYGAVGLPAGFALSDQVWVYVTPQLRAQILAPARLGAGLAWNAPSGLVLGAEIGAGYSPGVAVHLDASLLLGVQL